LTGSSHQQEVVHAYITSKTRNVGAEMEARSRNHYCRGKAISVTNLSVCF